MRKDQHLPSHSGKQKQKLLIDSFLLFNYSRLKSNELVTPKKRKRLALLP